MDLDWERKVYAIVLQAQQKSPAELAPFLEAVCEGDTRMRREVEKRLAGIENILRNARKLLE